MWKIFFAFFLCLMYDIDKSVIKGCEDLLMYQKKSEQSLSEICKALLEYADSFDPADLFPTVVPEAAKIIASDPYAFLIACCLDRGAKAETIWTIPYDIKNDLEHLDPFKIRAMSIVELTNLFTRLQRKPRYINDAPRTLEELTKIVVEECDGDASNIWRGKRSAEVNRTLDSVFGVGQGIANMTVLLIELANFRQFDAKIIKR